MPDVDKLLDRLRAVDGVQVWALIDASGLDRGRADIDTERFKQVECLFTGDLAVELNDVAPYLAELDVYRDDAAGIIQALMERECIVLLIGPSDRVLSFADLHRHLRKFNVVYGPDGQALFFRYSDSRTLPGVLEVMDAKQCNAFFGPLTSIVVPVREAEIVYFSLVDGALSQSSVA